MKIKELKSILNGFSDDLDIFIGETHDCHYFIPLKGARVSTHSVRYGHLIRGDDVTAKSILLVMDYK